VDGRVSGVGRWVRRSIISCMLYPRGRDQLTETGDNILLVGCFYVKILGGFCSGPRGST